MAALFPTGLETTPSSSFRRAAASPREEGIRLFVLGLAMGALLLLAGWILLINSASGLEPGGALPGAWPEGVNATQDSTQVRRPSAAKLPREWTWEKPAIRFDGMFREPR